LAKLFLITPQEIPWSFWHQRVLKPLFGGIYFSFGNTLGGFTFLILAFSKRTRLNLGY